MVGGSTMYKQPLFLLDAILREFADWISLSLQCHSVWYTDIYLRAKKTRSMNKTFNYFSNMVKTCIL